MKKHSRLVCLAIFLALGLPLGHSIASDKVVGSEEQKDDAVRARALLERAVAP